MQSSSRSRTVPTSANEVLWNGIKRVGPAYRWAKADLYLLGSLAEYEEVLAALAHALQLLGKHVLPPVGTAPCHKLANARPEVYDLIMLLSQLASRPDANTLMVKNTFLEVGKHQDDREVRSEGDDVIPFSPSSFESFLSVQRSPVCFDIGDGSDGRDASTNTEQIEVKNTHTNTKLITMAEVGINADEDARIETPRSFDTPLKASTRRKKCVQVNGGSCNGRDLNAIVNPHNIATSMGEVAKPPVEVKLHEADADKKDNEERGGYDMIGKSSNDQQHATLTKAKICRNVIFSGGDSLNYPDADSTIIDVVVQDRKGTRLDLRMPQSAKCCDVILATMKATRAYPQRCQYDSLRTVVDEVKYLSNGDVNFSNSGRLDPHEQVGPHKFFLVPGPVFCTHEYNCDCTS